MALCARGANSKGRAAGGGGPHGVRELQATLAALQPAPQQAASSQSATASPTCCSKRTNAEPPVLQRALGAPCGLSQPNILALPLPEPFFCLPLFASAFRLLAPPLLLSSRLLLPPHFPAAPLNVFLTAICRWPTGPATSHSHFPVPRGSLGRAGRWKAQQEKEAIGVLTKALDRRSLVQHRLRLARQPQVLGAAVGAHPLCRGTATGLKTANLG